MTEQATNTSPRKWYVLRTFTGHEKKVKQYLEREIERLGWEDRIGEIVIPTEKVFEIRQGKKRTRERTFLPGYVLIEAVLDNELQHMISNLPGVMGFLTTGGKTPTPLRAEEVDRILGKMDEARSRGEQPEVPFKVGEHVRVIEGPFKGFSGVVEEVHPDKMKLKVMVSIFGRKTPLELDYLQVEPEH